MQESPRMQQKYSIRRNGMSKMVQYRGNEVGTGGTSAGQPIPTQTKPPLLVLQ